MSPNSIEENDIKGNRTKKNSSSLHELDLAQTPNHKSKTAYGVRAGGTRYSDAVSRLVSRQNRD